MGTACAIVLAENPEQHVSLWARNADHAADMTTTRENKRLLPGITIPESVEITADIAAAVSDSDLLVMAVPTAFLRDCLSEISAELTDDRPVVSVIKGIENETFQRPSEIIGEVLGSRAVVSLSGPSHAEEITRRLPASVVAASGDLALARRVQQTFTTDRFRVYTNVDIIGVEQAAALKNVLAIAGDNAKSALMTRGLVEMTRFGTSLGAEAQTFAGLAGMGDLITTCASPYSRNRKVGERLGAGETLEEILQSMDAVAEGVWTTRSVHEMAQQQGIEMPITAEVFSVLFEGKRAVEATDSLMMRPPRDE